MKGLIVAALGSLVRVAGIEHMRIAIHRYSLAAVFGVLAVFFAIGAIVYGLGAAWFALVPKFGVIGAYLIVGGVLLLVSAILAFTARKMTKSPAPAAAPAASRNLPAISGGAFAGNGMAGLASAVIAGFIVGLVRGKSTTR
jgi:hypothetical protein